MNGFVKRTDYTGLGTLLELNRASVKESVQLFRSFLRQLVSNADYIDVMVMLDGTRFIPGVIAVGMEEELLVRCSLICVRARTEFLPRYRRLGVIPGL